MKPRRIDLHPDQFIAGVAGKMTPAQFGIYFMICLRIYSHGGPIADTDQELAGLFKKCNPRTVAAARSHLESISKLHRIDGELMANGCRIELEAAMNRMRTARENGSKRSASKDLRKAGGSTRSKPPAPSLPLSIPDSEAKASAAAAAALVDLKALVFGPVLVVVMKRTSRTERACRAWLGKLCSTYGDGEVLGAMVLTERNSPLDFIPYATKILKERSANEVHRNGAHRSAGEEFAEIARRTIEAFGAPT